MGVVLIPPFVTHYHLPDRRPFLNLSDLDDADAMQVMSALLRMRDQGLQSRSFGRVYLQWRRATEARMRELFNERSGEPLRLAPHYFVLGECRWYAGLARNMQAVTLAIADLPPNQTTFTLVDSFTAMGLGARFGQDHPLRPHQARLYLLEELDEVVGEYGLPDDDRPADGYQGYENRPVTQFIEIQVWCDEPVAAFLT
jgi:hypothetical protein